MTLRCLYIDTPLPDFVRLDSCCYASFLSAADLERYVAQPEYDLTAEFVARELSMGHECFGILEGDTLAAYGWYATTPTHFTDDLAVRFDRRWVYMFKGFTHPRYRGRRLHAIGMTLALTVYRSRGFRGLLSIVLANNTASLASCGRMGYRLFGTIYTARVGRLLGLDCLGIDPVIAFATPGCKAFGFRLERLSSAPPLFPVSAPVAVSGHEIPRLR